MSEKNIPSVLALDFVKYLKADLLNTTRPFFKIAFRLNEAKEFGYDKELGYEDIYELAQSEFGFKPTSTKNYIAVFQNYRDDNRSWTLPDCWSDYTFTQLVEMLSITKAERRLISPKMTIKEIRNWKRDHKLVEFNGKYCLYAELTDNQKKVYDKSQSTDPKVFFEKFNIFDCGMCSCSIPVKLSEPERNQFITVVREFFDSLKKQRKELNTKSNKDL